MFGLKVIFTWWNKQTVETFIYTLLKGKFVGKDQFGNKYYSDSKGKKRWVIYKNTIESSKIPPEWHLWIHYLTKNKPLEIPLIFKESIKYSEQVGRYLQFEGK